MSALVFVHGWSVTNTSTYGSLPKALADRAAQAGSTLRVLDIHLSEYVTFDDSVTMDDIVRAFDHALRGLSLPDGTFDCITHSTGGPVAMAWLHAQRDRPTLFAPIRLRHLVMLAPAHFGSALATLGKSVVGHLKAWFDGVEPGQRILDWLEHGSPESVAQALDVIHGPDPAAHGTWLFNLTGDRPDRKFYDFVNSYTGEDGSDGVVRMAAANLNARHCVLTQRAGTATLDMTISKAPRSAFKLLPGLAHSGGEHGIMASEPPSTVTIDAILRCLAVSSAASYAALCDAFATENAQRDRDKVETEKKLLTSRTHIHDPRSLLIFRLLDDRGEPLRDARFLLTAGPTASPNDLPPGFSTDRQASSRSAATVTMFLNYALFAGDASVPDPRQPGGVLRPAQPSHRPYGVRIQPADVTGLIRHIVAATASDDDLLDALGPHETTILDVVLSRRVAEGVFRLTQNLQALDFSQPVSGMDIV
ncbi:MAG: phospholipase [Luteibacter sp.]|uniref:esterase/lipase family protein n=1 Tax=Luteibacter sp. TaxID=1886636 RepID=UPI002809FEE5|nr:phospholipase [Luteibacter sp.]MDQ7996045.1 phospholipase [Luteibacter sp.]